LEPKLGRGKKRQLNLQELVDKSGKSEFLKGIFLVKLLLLSPQRVPRRLSTG
jgi:hypothetical protein